MDQKPIKCFLCKRNAEQVEEILLEKAMKKPAQKFSAINIGKGYIHICCICGSLLQKYFKEELFPSITPIFKQTSENMMQQFSLFFNTFKQMSNTILAEFDLSLEPIRQGNPPAKMNFEITQKEMESFIRNYVRGLNHIFSHFGFVVKKITKNEIEGDFPSDAPDPDSI
jgi:hypothetical protein